MQNSFRNELEIKLGPEKILLRPTFENLASMEADIGGIAYLGWKFSRGMKLGPDGKPDKKLSEEAIRAFPSLSEVAKIIYYNQAASKEHDPTQKKFSLEEIWDLVLIEGSSICKVITFYIARITAGDRMKNVDELTEEEKKS